MTHAPFFSLLFLVSFSFIFSLLTGGKEAKEQRTTKKRASIQFLLSITFFVVFGLFLSFPSPRDRGRSNEEKKNK